MRKILSLFAALAFSTTSTISVIACTETETEVGLPVAVSQALGFLGANNAPEKLPTIAKSTTDNSYDWSVDLTGVSLGDLLTGNNPTAPAKDSQCSDFITNTLDIKVDASGNFVRSQLVALDKFTEIESVNPVLSINANGNDYDLIGGFFTIQFKKDSTTNLGDEFIIPLKQQTNFVSQVVNTTIAASSIVLADVKIDSSKFKVNQPVSTLNLKVNDKIGINATTNGNVLISIGTILDQEINFSITSMPSTGNWKASDSIVLNLLIGNTIINGYSIALDPTN